MTEAARSQCERVHAGVCAACSPSAWTAVVCRLSLAAERPHRAIVRSRPSSPAPMSKDRTGYPDLHHPLDEFKRRGLLQVIHRPIGKVSELQPSVCRPIGRPEFVGSQKHKRNDVKARSQIRPDRQVPE